MVILFNGYPATILRRSYTLPILFLYCSFGIRLVAVVGARVKCWETVREPFGNRSRSVGRSEGYGSRLVGRSSGSGVG